MSSTPSPPPLNGASTSVPSPGILLVTINRPNQRNSIPHKLHWQLHALFTWFDNEPSLNVAVITGEGDKAFCAGQDLIELGKLTRRGLGRHELEIRSHYDLHTDHHGLSRVKTDKSSQARGIPRQLSTSHGSARIQTPASRE